VNSYKKVILGVDLVAVASGGAYLICRLASARPPPIFGPVPLIFSPHPRSLAEDSLGGIWPIEALRYE
jgi:hypothetical protein